MPSLEQTVEALVDLVCEVFMRQPNEDIRVRAQKLLVADFGRRLERDGRHAETGETRDEYSERIKRAGGKHPQTGDTLDDLAGAAWGKE